MCNNTLKESIWKEQSCLAMYAEKQAGLEGLYNCTKETTIRPGITNS